MPAHPRRDLVDDGEVGFYHCVARCVRRAFLCGLDPLSGKDFDHRKNWIRNRLEMLAGCFAVEVVSFAVMSNHLHVILRIRPDIATAWAPQEILRRWRLLSRPPKAKSATAADIGEAQPVDSVLETWRDRLSSVSWFMRYLCEPIARQANREDQCSGRFFQGRFSSVRLLDEAAVLACSLYVDLNPVRAGIADTPEGSEFTSAHDRIVGRQVDTTATTTNPVSPENPSVVRDPDGWLAPLPLAGDPEPRATRNAGRRASNRGVLEMTLDEYLKVLDWTGRQLRAGKRGVITAELPPILARLAADAGGWLDCVREFGRRFRAAAGRAEAMRTHAVRLGRRSLRGLGASRLAFG